MEIIKTFSLKYNSLLSHVSGRSTLPSSGRTGACSPFVSTFLIDICYYLNNKDMLQNDMWL